MKYVDKDEKKVMNMTLMTTFMLKENETKLHHFSRSYESEELNKKKIKKHFQ